MRTPRTGLAERRRLQGLSQEALAERLGVARTTVTRWEAGDVEPLAWVRPALANVLSLTLEDLAALLTPSAVGRDVIPSRVPAPDMAPAYPPYPLDDGELLDVAERRSWLASLDVSAAKIDYLAPAVEWIIDQDERVPPADLHAKARGLRSHLHPLLEAPQRPDTAMRLFAVAAHLSGAQAALSLDMGRLPSARAHAAEAFDLAETTGDPDLMAWARAAQSLVEYYAGRYPDALALANDGLARSPRGPHAVRLSVNGRARALARMGDRAGVDHAVGHAWTVRTEHPDPETALTASLTTTVYCEPRAAGNAATAYLAVGDTARVEQYANLALDTFDAEGFTGPQAMTRIDVATALLDPASGDVERAASLVADAYRIGGAASFPVRQRVAEFVDAAASWEALPAIRDVRELVSGHTTEEGVHADT
ncbi:DNA-binding XRE family transcriptional regulator [Promicromonospora sp. AC04]|uniref:helix-turn-helix domain-containing protein n=1 Tax=Promicromonospora sp. AC04 TaxID=2135723 RepID=UPI000D40740A|nr:helix-turn-helix transcriptional regulator [Promicromonospora sp. AC04]PUB27700.1 DNA-binding XRE family transcriptional regulator [Promicromonospora sp. AC04]